MNELFAVRPITCILKIDFHFMLTFKPKICHFLLHQLVGSLGGNTQFLEIFKIKKNKNKEKQKAKVETRIISI